MTKKPLVTVLIVTYNHADTFAQSIESVLCQKTNFNYEVWILDDCSNDGTKEIIKKYCNYKNTVYFAREKNIGKTENIYKALELINTKYYAILESDDYWCDENKLQTQVDILDNNPDCSFCAHNTVVNYTYLNTTRLYLQSQSKKFVFPPKKISKKYYIEPHTSSRLYRSGCLNLTEINNPCIFTSDIALNFYFLTKGNLYYIDKIMSVYNYTQKGSYSSMSPYWQRYSSACIIKELNEAFDYKYNNILARFFATRINLNFIKYLSIKHTKNKKKLNKLYLKILNDFHNKYLIKCDVKPISKFGIRFFNKRLVFEIKREKLLT